MQRKTAATSKDDGVRAPPFSGGARTRSFREENKRDAYPLNQIYDQLAWELDAMWEAVQSESDDEQVSRQQNSLRETLGEIRHGLAQNVRDLKDSAEWDRFTVAFYGETNAGKSTLIETLRILQGEETKQKTREAFAELHAERQALHAELDGEAQAASLSAPQTPPKTQAELSLLEEALQADIEALLQEAAQGRALRNEALLAKILEREELRLLKAATPPIADVKSSAERRERLVQLDEEMAKRADGAIIGNGRSDFTLKTQAYHFGSGPKAFDLLDVPGIEGDEAKVSQEIWGAVRKAHAVFYVTSKASAPQKGDEGQKGTLEKIREHLGAQTEVWTVFNKRVSNPMQLRGDSLISAGEAESLKVLDEKMRERLGENYQRTLSVSALPAFLGVAECLDPKSPLVRSREKFLKAFSSDEMIEQTNMLELWHLLSHELMLDYKVKIERSNLNKADVLLKSAIDQLVLQKESGHALRLGIEQDAESVCDQLDASVAGLRGRFDAKVDSAIRAFVSQTRNEIYGEIERNISNDDFKHRFQSIMQVQQQKLQHDLPKLIAEEGEAFRKDVSRVIARFTEFLQERMSIFEEHGAHEAPRINLAFDLDSGLRPLELVSALGGGLLMIWNPAGWFALAVGGLTILVGLVRSVWSFFSSNYKKSQQRKAVDENLGGYPDRMRKAVSDDLDKTVQGIQDALAEMKLGIREPARQLADLEQATDDAISRLKSLSTSILASR